VSSALIDSRLPEGWIAAEPVSGPGSQKRFSISAPCVGDPAGETFVIASLLACARWLRWWAATAVVTRTRLATATPNQIAIGGAVVGLELVIQNNLGDDLSRTAGAFTFAAPIDAGSNCGVTIKTNPPPAADLRRHLWHRPGKRQRRQRDHLVQEHKPGVNATPD
jgi:hypothetical protein